MPHGGNMARSRDDEHHRRYHWLGMYCIRWVLVTLLIGAGVPAVAQNSPPMVENVSAEQVQAATKYVEIDFDLSDAEGDHCWVHVMASEDGGATWTVPVTSVSGDVGQGIVPGAGKQIIWNPWFDIPAVSGSQYLIRLSANDGPVPPGMTLIPEGEYAMGCHVETGEMCNTGELPVHDVYVDSFYLDLHEVTNGLYCAYLNSAYALGLIEVTGGVVYQALGSEPYCDTRTSSQYSRINWNGSTFWVTSGKEDHPMLEVSWYGAAAYANWRSDQEGLTPCYNPLTWACDSGTGGYRLPTEAEWEKAARGGEYRPYYAYPWGNTVSTGDANYHPSFDPYESGDWPCTTPVGYYPANGYGLYDVSGNVYEWCNDWFDYLYYDTSPYDNPQGPGSGTFRVGRSGSWNAGKINQRCARRANGWPDGRGNSLGFRLAMNTSSGDMGSGVSGLFEINTEVVAAQYSCTPSSGTVPFSTQMTATLENLYPGQTRRIAARINVTLASGASYGNWKSGWTNVAASSSFVSTWNQHIPALGSVIGDNVFTLEAEDVTPSPYNQPPDPPVGDTDESACTVISFVP